MAVRCRAIEIVQAGADRGGRGVMWGWELDMTSLGATGFDSVGNGRHTNSRRLHQTHGNYLVYASRPRASLHSRVERGDAGSGVGSKPLIFGALAKPVAPDITTSKCAVNRQDSRAARNLGQREHGRQPFAAGTFVSIIRFVWRVQAYRFAVVVTDPPFQVA